MIRIIKGTYGLRVEGNIIPMGPGSEPFSVDKDRESELVGAGIAEYVEVETPVVEKPAEAVEETAEVEAAEEPVERQERPYRNGKKHRR